MGRPHQLRDGARITIRPLVPGDSEESRYRRFFSPVSHLGERELDYLTNIDHHDHEALVAIDEASGEGIAVARYVRIDQRTAEPAIAVVDDWQRRGVASELLDALSQRAREEGVERFIAPVLAENAGAIKTFRRLGATSHEPLGREIELTIDLSEPGRARPMLRELLRAAASGLVEPARSVWELFVRHLPPPQGFGESIIVGIEHPEEAAVAVDQARELALRLKLPVHLVAAYRPVLDDVRTLEQTLQRAERRLRNDGIEVSTRLQRGDPALAILYAAMRERAGLVVLGSPPPGSGRSTQLGNAVAHNSHCSVLIARPPRR
jgi:nucleotide-binding universal stress UspA family protein